jgi:hypothetical protein
MDESHVLGLLPKCSDAAVLERDAAKDDPRLKGEDEYRYMLVMDRADGDLSDALSHARVAGRDLRGVVEIARQVAGHLRYLNEECNRLHGDIKPRNVVKITHGMKTTWVLIDLDASCTIGTPAGLKKTSSSCYPPEMARHELMASGLQSDHGVESLQARIDALTVRM